MNYNKFKVVVVVYFKRKQYASVQLCNLQAHPLKTEGKKRYINVS